MKCWPSLAAYGRTLPMPGGDLFYYDSEYDSENGAQGKPVVALVHGLGDEADTWRHVFPALSGAGYRALAPDLPGFGRSVWKGAIGIGAHCRAVARLMAFAGAGPRRPAALVGNSLGAGIAELVACRLPDRVSAIALIAGCFPFEKSASARLFALSLPFAGKKWYRGFRGNPDAAWKSLHSYYADLDAMDGADRDFLRERVAARVESGSQERGYLSTARSMAFFFAFGSRRVARAVKKFPGKISVVCGEKDAVFPPEKAGLFRSLRPDAGFAVVGGAGHLPHQEKPEACAAEILRLLGGAPPERRSGVSPR